ncbi:hypothetical protein [Tabrizicola sp.]|uniref:hypothetical protein n=1 Tax=Tabrizicola sp. TaxID=2005166 RepID=UPI0026299B12|nr:hypothetical protein [Tabrizicola sp.]MDM7932866.1 hypothetical protein [Tabrizicola sp.]
MPAIKTKQPITSINVDDHPQANRVAKEEYLAYSYPNLTLFEDFSSGMARKETKWFAVLKDKDETTYYIKRGTQEHSLTYVITDFAPFEGHRFTSAFIAAKALDEYLSK